MVENIKLRINDEDIPLNPIMSKVLNNIIIGFIDVLKGIPEDKKNIRVDISL
ncbi:MAG: hypothetical protein ACFFAO_04360 [Candidatus Hermodarchaeota archaeon]